MQRVYNYLLVGQLTGHARCHLTAMLFLALASFLSPVLLAQEVKKCQELDKQIDSLEKSRRLYSALAEIARKFDFYKGFAAKLKSAVAGGQVVPELENYTELFEAAEAGSPGSSVKERLDFQKKFLPVLEGLLNEILHYPDEETFRPKIQDMDEKLEPLREEYRGLKCGQVLRDNASAGEMKFLGCFKDSNNPFDLDGFLERSSSNTPESCVAKCRAKGFAFAGVQYGESCLCGNSFGKQGTSTACNIKCTGDSSKVCGGLYCNSVYGTGVVVPK